MAQALRGFPVHARVRPSKGGARDVFGRSPWTLRFLNAKAEFTSQLQNQPEASREAEERVSVSTLSAPETTETGALLQALRASETTVSHKLQILEEMGLQEQWLLPADQLSMTAKVLGRGGFGSVFQGVKVFQAHEASIDASCLNELRFLRHLHHPNIVLFIGACVDREHGDLKLVLEKVHGLTLQVYMQQLGQCAGQLRECVVEDSSAKLSSSSTAVSAKTIGRRQHGDCVKSARAQVEIMEGIIQALIYLHSRKPIVVHADLKPSNVIVSTPHAHPVSKLLDFGLSRAVTHKAMLRGGTQHFMAPEIAENEQRGVKPSRAVDIFALGRLQCYVATLGKRTVPADAPGSALLDEWRGVIEACTDHDAFKRPTAKEVYGQLFGKATAPVTRPQSETLSKTQSLSL